MQKKKQIILAMKFSQGGTKLHFETPGGHALLDPGMCLILSTGIPLNYAFKITYGLFIETYVRRSNRTTLRILLLW